MAETSLSWGDATGVESSLIEYVVSQRMGLVEAAADEFNAIVGNGQNAYGESGLMIDQRLEDEVLKLLAGHGSVDVVLSEESGPIELGHGELTVVLDPLDGTRNYCMGFTHFAMAMAVLDDRHQVKAGLVVNLATGTWFAAARGGGARRNGLPITCEGPTSLADVDAIFVGLSHDPGELAALAALAERLHSFHAMGCSALDVCCLAMGHSALFVDLSNTLKPVDVLASALIASEAGALIQTLDGVPLVEAGVHGPDLVEAVYGQRLCAIGAANAAVHHEAVSVMDAARLARS